MDTRGDGTLISAPEMARQLGVGEATIYRYIAKGLIRSTRRRWGLRYRYDVLRADFERALPGLMGIDRSDTLSEDIRKPTRKAALA